MTSSGVLPIRSQGYYIALQYPDEAQPQVVRLSEPTVECLKETIDKDTDMFLNRDIDILYELNHVLMKLTAVPEQVTELIKRSSFQNMECFHVRPKKRRTPPVRTLSTPTLLPPHSGSSKVYDGFLSYQWGCQDMAKRIVDDLTQLHNLRALTVAKSSSQF
ncbi:hypothetical protein DFJ73DRAFT_155115 [Zopfochytrium polystomum]|nr:hypothetical protein DFJ73DRAFT_155115 [Zopfochytrium polystomum]